MHIKLLATDSKLSSDRYYRLRCALPSMHVYSAKCMGRLQLSPRTEVLPNMSVHRYGNDTKVRVSYRILSLRGGGGGGGDDLLTQSRTRLLFNTCDKIIITILISRFGGGGGGIPTSPHSV